MADFTRAVTYTLSNEGILSNDANDSGGLTKWGISTPTFAAYQQKTGLLTERKLASLTRDEAVAIYRALFWRYDDVQSQMIATKLFDLGVNMGLSAAVLLLQQALRMLDFDVAADGLWGPTTLAAVNSLQANRPRRLLLFKAMVYQAARRYVLIVGANTTQLDFIDGWLARCARRPED